MARRMLLLSVAALAVLAAAPVSSAGPSDEPGLHWVMLREPESSGGKCGGWCHFLFAQESEFGHPRAQQAKAQAHGDRAAMKLLERAAGPSQAWGLSPATPKGRRILHHLEDRLEEDGEATVKIILIGETGRSRTSVRIDAYNKRCNPDRDDCS